jgi:hypothetical protein
VNRGELDLTVYTFEAGPRGDLEYPGGGLWTRDYREAQEYARAHHCQLIANEYEWRDDEVLEDYTEEDAADD